jgi:hypothetical protein
MVDYANRLSTLLGLVSAHPCDVSVDEMVTRAVLQYLLGNGGE